MALTFKRRKKEGAEAKTAKPVAFKAKSGARFVLFIGDEGTILVHIKGNAVLSRQFVPDSSEQNLRELRETFEKDPKAPVMLVIDTIDQSYIQQTLPPVSSLSVKKLIKRRLDRDFGPNDIKGAIVLGREKTGRKDWNFLMISLEKSPQFTAWLDFAGSLPNRFQGIYLVAVEVENILKSLELAMGVPKEGTGSEWKFFVSHNKVGGFRQVILRNGRIVFTRMAQPIGDSTPEVVAGNIEQEMLSTIEYMRRLSYTAQAGLDIYIIASSGIKSAIDRNKFESRNMEILTPYEVAQYLNIEGATQPTDQFGDVILAAGIGCSRKHVLKLSTPKFERSNLIYKGFLGQRAALALVVLGIVGYAGSLAYDLYNSYSAISDLETNKATQQQGLQKLRTDIQAAHVDIENTNDVLDLYEQMLREEISPLPFIAKLQEVVKPPIGVKSVEWSLPDEKGAATGAAPAAGAAAPAAAAAAAAASGGNKQSVKIQAVVTVTFPQGTNAESFKVLSKQLLANMKTMFKGATVTYTKLPTGFSENEKLDVNFTEKADTTKDAQDIEAQITIKGEQPLPLPAPSPPGK